MYGFKISILILNKDSIKRLSLVCLKASKTQRILFESFLTLSLRVFESSRQYHVSRQPVRLGIHFKDNSVSKNLYF